MTIMQIRAASTGAAGFFQVLKDNPGVIILFLLIGVAIGLVWGIIYSRLRAKYFSNEADQKIRSIVEDFKKEKDTSETILRELQVGVLAYGADGRFITGNPSANALLGMREVPKTIQSFLNRYGKENGISLALMLQTTNVTGNVNVQDRIVRLRLTRAQLSMFRNPSWIIIIQDITEQEREEKQRKEFVANVSHELKTPLTTISAYSETLLDWGLEGKPLHDVKSDISRIHDDCERMDNLVQNLLLLSSIDSKGIRPRMIQYDVVSIMRQIVGRMNVQALEKDIQLQSSVLSIIPPVYGDANAIDRILTNLVSNAIKYTDKGGQVNVSVQLTNNYISLKIVDNGMGVAKDNLPRLFDRFYRVDSTGSRKYGGTGLGLSIAKELTELQGGTISVSSTFGKGTEFVVTIPKAETTYRETLAAILSDSPRSEILYENARQYLEHAAEEIELPIYGLENITEEQGEDLLSYLLITPEDEHVNLPAPSMIPMGSVPQRAEYTPNMATKVYEPSRRRIDHPDRATTPVSKVDPTTGQPSVQKSVKLPEQPIIQKSVPRTSSVMQPIARSTSATDRRPSGSSERRHSDKPMQRNADAVARSTPTMQSTSKKKEPSDRLTKSKIHPDNRHRADFSNRNNMADDSAERKIVTIEDLQEENMRGKRHVKLPD